jgi:hypothetical protein
VVALLYTLSENAEVDANGHEEIKEELSAPTHFQELIDRVSKEELWKFILEGMKADPQLKNRFLVHFAEYTAEDDPQKKYRALIKSYYNQALQRSGYGYIDYRSAATFTGPLYELNEKANQLLASGNIQESLAICKSLIEEVSGVIDSIDDSNGSAGDVITFAFDTVSNLASDPGFYEKEKLFDWCLQESSKNKYGDFGFEYNFLQLLPELITSREQEVHLFRIIDKKIEEEKSSNYPEFGIKKLVRTKIDYFKRNERDEEAEELISRYNYIAEFRELQVEDALKYGNIDLAKKLCMEGIKIAKELRFPGIVTLWYEWLFKIAKNQDDISEIRKYAEILFFENHYSLEWYRQLKANWPSEQWTEKRDEIIDRIKGGNRHWSSWHADSLASIYIEEEFMDSLLQLARLNSQDIRFISRYAGKLADDYPEEILEFYENAIKKFAEQTGRKYYKEAVRYLKEMTNLKGGDEKAYLLIKELLQTYNNRPAMKDEFRKKFPAWV